MFALPALRMDYADGVSIKKADRMIYPPLKYHIGRCRPVMLFTINPGHLLVPRWGGYLLSCMLPTQLLLLYYPP